VDRALSFVLMEALTTWSNFVREFYLSCAFLHPKTISGSHVSHIETSIRNERDALVHAIQVLKGRRISKPTIGPHDEPSWREKRALSSLSQSMTLSNNPAIVAGLSVSTTFFDQAHTVRNFYAHRSERTATSVRDLARREYGIGIAHPNSLINAVLAGRVETLLQEWLGDIREIAQIMCN
jgi:hypothetical protein